VKALSEPAFARLWSAAFFSESAEWMLQVALPVFIYQSTGSAASAAASVVLGLLPAVLLSPVAGVLADRWNRRVMLCAVCAGQVVAAPLLLVAGVGRLPLVYLVMATQAGPASLFEPARNALIPELVAESDLTGANGLMAVSNSGSVSAASVGWSRGISRRWWARRRSWLSRSPGRRVVRWQPSTSGWSARGSRGSRRSG
jgi:MFS family permease